MRFQHVLVLSLDEVRQQLTEWYADMVVNDRANVLEVIRNDGNLRNLCPDLKAMDPEQLAELFGELNLGEELVLKKIDHVDLVVVETKPEHYTMVWALENYTPIPDETPRKVFRQNAKPW